MTPQMQPHQVITHEGQPLLQRRVKGSIGPGGSLQFIDERANTTGHSKTFVRSAVLIAAAVIGIGLILHLFVPHLRWPGSEGNSTALMSRPPDVVWQCTNSTVPCLYKREMVRVSESNGALPSFWKYAPHGPINVSYDERSILLNGTRVLLLGGSFHPVRATLETWTAALDEAAHHGLNLVTIYVFWSAHQPSLNDPFDWSYGDGLEEWNLARAIREAANRGLFVHARIGPYECAEYSYGGIPEWLPLEYPDMSMRRADDDWYNVMEEYVKNVLSYLQSEQLFGYQGGPIILAQIENELGDNAGLQQDVTFEAQETLTSIQEYANWCGDLAHKYQPNVVWTMCNGVTAPNTINTCNSESCTGWVESYGQSGEIQKTQPAMWTEDEAGFQIWGDDPLLPSSYFWGRSGRSFARSALQWFARGGTHLNYYMFWGGYNRGRTAAGGIANKYASDAILCSSGQRRQPKFGHLQSMHQMMADIAPVLLNSPSALFKSLSIKIEGEDGKWVDGTEQRMFVYSTSSEDDNDDGDDDDDAMDVCFVENDSGDGVIARLELPSGKHLVTPLSPHSAAVVVNGILVFDSESINPRHGAYRRVMKEAPVDLLDWKSFDELVGADAADNRTILRPRPVEQTQLMAWSQVSSDYAWFTSSQFDVPSGLSAMDAYLKIETQRANAMSVYLNSTHVGTLDNHQNGEGSSILMFDLGHIPTGTYTFSILSENFGYSNEIGRFGVPNTKAKVKGVTGAITLIFNKTVASEESSLEVPLIYPYMHWLSYAGLHGENMPQRFGRRRLSQSLPSRIVWSRALFDTPSFDATAESLFLDITVGRGHVWLNDHDLGRYWNITNSRGNYTQRHYLIPQDYLYSNGKLNRLVFVNTMGGELSASTKLVLSGLVEDENSILEDDIDYPTACM